MSFKNNSFSGQNVEHVSFSGQDGAGFGGGQGVRIAQGSNANQMTDIRYSFTRNNSLNANNGDPHADAANDGTLVKRTTLIFNDPAKLQQFRATPISPAEPWIHDIDLAETQTPVYRWVPIKTGRTRWFPDVFK
jgi:hypothetical protein